MTISGLHADTGQSISGLDHLQQSITTILTTLIGTRPMRREFGSLVPLLIDQPDNGTTRVRLYSAVATALMRWEPDRLRLSSITLESTTPGQSAIVLAGTYIDPDGQQQLLNLRVPVANQAAAT
jgi:phage baseplate assembly protein W